MTELATRALIKEIEQNCGIDPRELMQNAAECLFARIESSKAKYMFSLGAVAVVCGTGNNAGDGYALAILLYESGYNVKIVAADRPHSSDALYYFSLCSDMGIDIVYIQEQSALALDIIFNSTFIVDAMLGIGLLRNIEEPYDELIDAVNNSSAFVLSVDIPSGIYADSADIAFCDSKPMCVHADMTSAFIMKKAGHVSYPGVSYCGDVYVEDIGIPPETLENVKFSMFETDDSIIRDVFVPRKAHINKGDCGTLVMLCGCGNMTGAASLCAKGAVRSGAGLVVCAAQRATLDVLQTRMDFPVFFPLETDGGLYDQASLEALISYPKATAFAVGCGLGRSAAAQQAVEYIIENSRVPLVLDADALNIISQNPDILKKLSCPAVITPHPAEMARLCGVNTEYVQNNRIYLASRFAREYNVITVLKGSATVIASPDGRCVINTAGTPAMAKGGMGDVLTGVIGSLIAQGKDLFDSAVCGVYVHALAGEMGAQEYSQYGLSPEDMPILIAKVIKNKTAHNLV